MKIKGNTLIPCNFKRFKPVRKVSSEGVVNYVLIYYDQRYYLQIEPNSSDSPIMVEFIKKRKFMLK